MNKKKTGLIGLLLIMLYSVAGVFAFYQPHSVLDYSVDEYNREGRYDSSIDVNTNNNYSNEFKSESDLRAEDKETMIIICVSSFLLFVIILGAIYDHIKKGKQTTEDEQEKSKARYYLATKAVADKETQKFFPELTKDQLLNILFERFIRIQEAQMNFDYKTLEKLCSDELYNSYKEELKELESNHQKRIMKDFNVVTYNLNSISEENDIVIIKTFLHMTSYDYIIDSKTNEIINGTDSTIVHGRCQLNFIVKKGITLTKCPSCGAKVMPGDSECDYCHTIIINNYGDFVLNSCNWTK